jgi:hypothetical protein
MRNGCKPATPNYGCRRFPTCRTARHRAGGMGQPEFGPDISSILVAADARTREGVRRSRSPSSFALGVRAAPPARKLPRSGDDPSLPPRSHPLERAHVWPGTMRSHLAELSRGDVRPLSRSGQALGRQLSNHRHLLGKDSPRKSMDTLHSRTGLVSPDQCVRPSGGGSPHFLEGRCTNRSDAGGEPKILDPEPR